LNNLAFDLPNGKGLSEDNPLQAYKIISLWELMEFIDFGKILVSVSWLSNLAHRAGNVPWFRIPVREYELMKERVSFLCDELERLDFPTSLISARELRTIIFEETEVFDKEVPPGTPRSIAFPSLVASRYFSFTQELSRHLEYELYGKLLMILPSNKVGYFDGSKEVLSEEARNAFFSAEYEMDEAGKCFALARYTACVFHAMRALEPGLKALGADLDLSVETNWNKALDQIEKEIRSRSTKTHGPAWKDDEPFYAEAATHFRFIKNAWRNHTAHLKERYDEERAESVLRHVGEFLRDIANRLHE